MKKILTLILLLTISLIFVKDIYALPIDYTNYSYSNIIINMDDGTLITSTDVVITSGLIPIKYNSIFYVNDNFHYILFYDSQDNYLTYSINANRAEKPPLISNTPYEYILSKNIKIPPNATKFRVTAAFDQFVAPNTYLNDYYRVKIDVSQWHFINKQTNDIIKYSRFYYDKGDYKYSYPLQYGEGRLDANGKIIPDPDFLISNYVVIKNNEILVDFLTFHYIIYYDTNNNIVGGGRSDLYTTSGSGLLVPFLVYSTNVLTVPNNAVKFKVITKISGPLTDPDHIFPVKSLLSTDSLEIANLYYTKYYATSKFELTNIFDDVLNTIGFNNKFGRLLFGLIFLIIPTIVVFLYTKKLTPVIIIIGFGTSFFTLLGWFDVWILITVLLVIAIYIIINFGNKGGSIDD